MERLHVDEGLETVGQLDLSAGATLTAPENPHHLRLEDVAAHDREIRRSDLGMGFLDEVADRHELSVVAVGCHDAVPRRVLAIDLHQGYHVAAVLFVCGNQIADLGVAENQVVGQKHGEGIIPDECSGTPDGMTQAQGPHLPHESKLSG